MESGETGGSAAVFEEITPPGTVTRIISITTATK
jgi:hypothetical protein